MSHAADREFSGPSIAEVAEMLAARADTFCRTYLRGGVRVGHLWRCSDVYGNPGQALAVTLSGPKAGRWADYKTERGGLHAGGDLIDLICAQNNCDKKEAFRIAKSFLGITDETHRQSETRAEVARAKARLDSKAVEIDAETREKQRRARRLFTGARAAENTVAEAYLRGRGITLPMPGVTRLVPVLEHPYAKISMPCMVTAVLGLTMKEGEEKASYEIIGVHRTWLVVEELADINFVFDHHVLDLDAGAHVRRFKHEVKGRDTGKLALGPVSGGVIPLTTGREQTTLVISEGIENGLSFAQAQPDVTAWSALNAGNMINVIIPTATRRLIYCADGDSSTAKNPDGTDKLKADGSPYKPADEALKRAAQLQADLAADAGRPLQVEIWRPEPGMDANDMLRRGML